MANILIAAAVFTAVIHLAYSQNTTCNCSRLHHGGSPPLAGRAICPADFPRPALPLHYPHSRSYHPPWPYLLET
jgi:hypothetical protein